MITGNDFDHVNAGIDKVKEQKLREQQRQGALNKLPSGEQFRRELQEFKAQLARPSKAQKLIDRQG